MRDHLAESWPEWTKHRQKMRIPVRETRNFVSNESIKMDVALKALI